ncbi:MAG: DUF2793 domain-containing protein [Hyphomonadaceae bacterium]|nr:DUF2793 domain-containing protein [Hyphomonadaceae bacterium]
MSDFSTNLILPFLQPAQAQKHVTVNESLLRFDALVQGAVESRFTAAQPANPADGARYILPPGKTGAAWGAMSDHAVAYWRDGVWEQIAPRSGFRFHVRDENRLVVFDGTHWSMLASPGESLLVNGGFPVWQRGVSFTSVASGTYAADRWRTAAAAMTVSRSADAPAGAQESLQAVAGTSAWSIAQRIERRACASLAGNRVCAAFWAKSVDGTGALSVAIVAANAADDFSATTAVQTIALDGLDTTWRRFTVVFDPAPSSCANGVELTITRAAPGGTARIALVQLHAGADAPFFAHRSPAEELAACQRYFEKSHNLAVAPGGAPGAGNCTASVGAPGSAAYATLAFKVSKRAAPAFTVFDGAGAAGKLSYYDTAWRNAGTPTVASASEGGFFVQANIAGSLIVNYDWTASAEL